MATCTISGMYQIILLAFRQFVDDLADAAFELADIDLVGLQIGAAGFEDAPAVGREPLRQQPQERRLADQGSPETNSERGGSWRSVDSASARASRQPPARPASRCRAGSTRIGRPRSTSCKTWLAQPASTASARHQARG